MLLLLASLVVDAQNIAGYTNNNQKYAWYGGMFRRPLGIMPDTVTLTEAEKPYPWLAPLGDSLYLWSVATQKWVLAGGAGGGSAVDAGVNVSIDSTSVAGRKIIRALSVAITPDQITGNVDNYNPPGLDSASVIRISADADGYNITGLEGGVDGRIVIVQNVGAESLILTSEDGSSDAENQFLLSSNVLLAANTSILLQYDGTSEKWRDATNYAGASLLFARTDARNETGSAMYFSAAGQNFTIDSVGEYEITSFLGDDEARFQFSTEAIVMRNLNVATEVQSQVRTGPGFANIAVLSPEFDSQIIVNDSVLIKPPLGNFHIDTLNHIPNPGTNKMMVWDSATGHVGTRLLPTGLTNPMTTTGDIIYSSDGSGTPARLGIGTEGQVLAVSAGGIPEWVTVSGTGTVTSFSFTDANGFDGTVTDATTTPTLSITTTATETNVLFAGTSGAIANDDAFTFVNADDLATLTVGESGGSRGAIVFQNASNSYTLMAPGSGTNILELPTNAGTSGQVLTKGSGNTTSWQDAGGTGTVTSVALSTGTTGTDVNVSGSPITTSGTITLNIPDASATARGLMTTGTQTIAGVKTFSSGISSPLVTATTTLAAAATNAGNFTFIGGSISASTSTSNFLVESAGGTNYRQLFYGSTATTLTANNNYGTIIMGNSAVTEAASGTHPLISTMILRAPAITGGSATVTNGATLYIEGAPSGTFATGTNSLYIAGGGVRMGAFGAGTATFDASGNISSSSDGRLKNIQGHYNAGLKELMKIEPIVYKWKPGTNMETSHTYAGFDARNIHNVLGDLATGKDGNGYYTIQDRALIAMLINAVQEQQKQIDQLKKRK